MKVRESWQFANQLPTAWVGPKAAFDLHMDDESLIHATGTMVGWVQGSACVLPTASSQTARYPRGNRPAVCLLVLVIVPLAN